MKRRSLLATFGVAAAGTAIGTGAFTSVEAERSVSVNIADEDEALLAMEPIDNDIAQDRDRNEIRLDFNDVLDTNGRGPGSESEYQFDRIFEVRNQGTQTVYFETDFEQTQGDPDLDEIGFYVEQSSEFLLDGDTAVLELETGDAAALGTKVETFGVDPELDNQEEFDFDATISVGDEQPEDVVILDEDGNEVDNGGGGGGG